MNLFNYWRWRRRLKKAWRTARSIEHVNRWMPNDIDQYLYCVSKSKGKLWLTGHTLWMNPDTKKNMGINDGIIGWKQLLSLSNTAHGKKLFDQ